MRNTANWIVDVGERDFRQAVIEASTRVPVLVDFWADWCAPCRSLAPILERLAVEYRGAFVLARVNTEKAPALAQALQIRSIPLVVLFRDGRPVDRFVGALPEADIRAFLSRHIQVDSGATPTDMAERRLALGDLDGAERTFRKVLQEDPQNAAALAGLGEISFRRGNIDEAEKRLGEIPSKATPTEGMDRLRSLIALRRQAVAIENAGAATRNSSPSETAGRYDEALLKADRGKLEDALEILLEIVRRDRQFKDDGARKLMLEIFKIAGIRSPLSEKFRTRLSTILF